MLAFIINVAYLLSLLLVPATPVEANQITFCKNIEYVLLEAIESGDITPEEMAEIIDRCEKLD